MSFICQVCGVAQQARTKPILHVLETRPKDYLGPERDEDGDIMEDRNGKRNLVPVSVGHETVREILMCPPCMSLPIPTQPKPDMSMALLLAKRHEEHARKCQGWKMKTDQATGKRVRTDEPCAQCVRILASFASMSDLVLNYVLAEVAPSRVPKYFQLGSIVFENAVNRADDAAKHGQMVLTSRPCKDATVAYGVLKSYEDGGGKL